MLLKIQSYLYPNKQASKSTSPLALATKTDEVEDRPHSLSSPRPNNKLLSPVFGNYFSINSLTNSFTPESRKKTSHSKTDPRSKPYSRRIGTSNSTSQAAGNSNLSPIALATGYYYCSKQILLETSKPSTVVVEFEVRPKNGTDRTQAYSPRTQAWKHRFDSKIDRTIPHVTNSVTHRLKTDTLATQLKS